VCVGTRDDNDGTSARSIRLEIDGLLRVFCWSWALLRFKGSNSLLERVKKTEVAYSSCSLSSKLQDVLSFQDTYIFIMYLDIQQSRHQIRVGPT